MTPSRALWCATSSGSCGGSAECQTMTLICNRPKAEGESQHVTARGLLSRDVTCRALSQLPRRQHSGISILEVWAKLMMLP